MKFVNLLCVISALFAEKGMSYNLKQENLSSSIAGRAILVESTPTGNDAAEPDNEVGASADEDTNAYEVLRGMAARRTDPQDDSNNVG